MPDDDTGPTTQERQAKAALSVLTALLSIRQHVKTGNLVAVCSSLLLAWAWLKPAVTRQVDGVVAPVVEARLEGYTNAWESLRIDVVRLQARMDDREAWSSNRTVRASELEARVTRLESERRGNP